MFYRLFTIGLVGNSRWVGNREELGFYRLFTIGLVGNLYRSSKLSVFLVRVLPIVYDRISWKQVMFVYFTWIPLVLPIVYDRISWKPSDYFRLLFVDMFYRLFTIGLVGNSLPQATTSRFLQFYRLFTIGLVGNMKTPTGSGRVSSFYRLFTIGLVGN